MKPKSLWTLAVTIDPEAEEAAAELLARSLNAPVASYLDLETGSATVSAFLKEKPATPSQLQRELRAGLAQLESCGLKTAPGTVRVRKVRGEDWAESWKRHFKPLVFGAKLLVKPSWSRRKPSAGQAVVTLDPGLSFGTGQHATTSFCLSELVRLRKPGLKQSFLDAGTGSGILAIAAAVMGWGPVRAFDFDPEALRVARQNARANHVMHKIRFWRQDVARLPLRPRGTYDVICANLISNLLLAHRERLLRQLSPGGVIVLAGILTREFAAVRAGYEAAGLRLLRKRTEREWTSGSFGWREGVWGSKKGPKAG